MIPKEKIKEFNQRFLTLRNKIPTAARPAEEVTLEFYTSALPLSVAMFVKRDKLATLEETFEKAILVEKEMTNLKSHPTNESDTASSSRKKNENPNKNVNDKKEQDNFDMENLQRVIMKLSNDMIDMKKNNTKTNQNCGYFRPPFRRNFQNRPPNPPPEGLNIEEVANVLKALISTPDTHDDSNADDCQEEESVERDEEDDPDDPHAQTINHFWDLFEEKDVEVENANVSQHPYNTRNRPNQGNDVASTSTPDKNNANLKNSGSKESIPQ